MDAPLTRLVPWSELVPGDRLLVPYGIVTLERLEMTDSSATIHPVEKEPAVTVAVGSWPELVIEGGR